MRNMEKIKQNIRRIIYLSFLLGFPWILGIFMLLAQETFTKTIFSILFTIFLTLQVAWLLNRNDWIPFRLVYCVFQGVVIFLAFCATDDVFKSKITAVFATCGRGFRAMSSDGTTDSSLVRVCIRFCPRGRHVGLRRYHHLSSNRKFIQPLL